MSIIVLKIKISHLKGFLSVGVLSILLSSSVLNPVYAASSRKVANVFRDSDFKKEVIVLPKNLINGSNTLTQAMMSSPNRVYVIRHNYVLGTNIVIPKNCELVFEGGSIVGNKKNNTIVCQATQIQASRQVFDNTIVLRGVSSLNVAWFGINPDSEDVSKQLNCLLSMLSDNIEYEQVRNNIIYYWLHFQEAQYNVESTIYVDGRINICGNPTFHMTNNNATCVYIKNGWQSQYKFNVERQRPTICKNENSIGVVVENCMYCRFDVHRIQCFTKGIIVRADGGEKKESIGCGWNVFYIDAIYAPVWGFVIESKNRGWPNANNVYGGMGFNTNTGWSDFTDCSLPYRSIVVVSDGLYGCNGWKFDGVWFEQPNSAGLINGEKFYAVDFSDYINGQPPVGISFSGVRLEYDSRPFKINSGCSQISISFTTKTGSNFNMFYAVNEREEEIVDPDIFNFIDENKHKTIFELEAGIDDIKNDVLRSKGKIIFKDGKYLAGGIGKNAIRRDCNELNTADAPSVLLNNVTNKTLKIISKGDISIKLLDDTFRALKPGEVPEISFPGFYQTNFNSPAYDWHLRKNVSDVISRGEISIGNNSRVKYIQLVFSEKLTTLKVECISHDGSFPFIYNPYGTWDGYAGSISWDSLRAVLPAGSKYIDYIRGITYLVLTAGSVGNIGTIRVEGKKGDNFLTTKDSVSNLLIGDIIMGGWYITDIRRKNEVNFIFVRNQNMESFREPIKKTLELEKPTVIMIDKSGQSSL